MIPKNLDEFPVGSFVRSIYSNKTYEVISHSQGMSIVKTGIKDFEKWNSFNNAHFVYANFVELGVITLLYYAK